MPALLLCQQIMAAGCNEGGLTLTETEIRGAKLEKNVEELSRAEAERWLKCRGCRNLSELTLNGLKSKINSYIKYGWDKLLLKDTDGKIQEEKRKKNLNAEERLLERFLEGEAIPAEGWTSSLEEIPQLKHSVVEEFFQNSEEKRHLTDGYAFSKTRKFETSGKPLRVNLLPGCDNMFLLEGHTRPAMKQAKGISSGSGIYCCVVVFDKLTGKILAARDRSCAAGKRGFCKHIAALCYKLVELKMSSAKKLPQPLSCTEIRQQWGIPSIKAQQDPEKELMKKNPLHEIKFEQHVLTRDQTGGRKRRVPQEVSSGYTSKPAGEPVIDTAHLEVFKKDLSNSESSFLVAKFIRLDPCLAEPSLEKENTPFSSTSSIGTPRQRSEAWFSQRIGKITSSKAPAVIGLYGKKEFCETWDCIKKKLPEPTKNFRNFQRGIIYEEVAATCFSAESSVTLSECGMFVLTSDNRFAASPDRIFDGEACSMLTNVNTSEKIQLAGQCLLEIKTRAEGQTEPLPSVTAAHVCQTELQMKCVGDKVNFTILQSFVPESKKSKYFLIARNDSVIASFLNTCSSAFNTEQEFDSLLGLRQSMNAIAKSCPEVSFVSV